ncbi:MAG TPA: PadR family transcriptional regulator [Dehalococcoidia bacterium]|nr:PadR family transcriptional regulator [Dehalococcoidia bacterium]
MSSSPFSVLRGEALKGHLDVILLSVLAEGPAYGYAIISKLEEWTGGELNLSDGTVYPALHRLENAGLLKSRYAVEAGRRRRIYSLTERGQAEYRRLRDEWMAFTEGVQRVLEHAGGGSNR